MQLKKTFNKETAWKIIFFSLILVVLFFANFNKPWHRKYITSDGFGYYGYLPAVFIYQDLKFGFIEFAQNKEYTNYGTADFRRQTENGIVNICYVGSSILWTPFFLVSHSYALLSKYEANGYTLPYQIGILFAGIFYFLLGLWALGKVFDKLGISIISKSITLYAIVLATPILYYSIVEPSFSHVYSFTLINLFLLALINFFNKFKIKFLILASIIAALIGLIRPTNGLLAIFLIPFCIPADFKFANLYTWIRNRPLVNIGLPVVLFLVVLSIQPFIYYLQTGHLFVWSYQGGSFDFSNPQITNILFSYKKGLFVYTPILLFALPGLFKLYKFSPIKSLTILFNFLVTIYILASWWSWWFGMSLAHRAFIDFYGLWFIPITFGFENYGKYYKFFFIYTALIFIVYFQILSQQYRHYVLDWDMNKEKFWRVFLHTSKPYHGFYWEEEKISNRLKNTLQKYPDEIKSSFFSYENVFENKSIQVGKANSGFNSLKIPSGKSAIYSDTISIDHEVDNYAILVQLSLFTNVDLREENVIFNCEIRRDNKTIINENWMPQKMNVFSGQWNRTSYILEVQKGLKSGDIINFYIDNNQSKTIFLDDLFIKIQK